MRLLLICILYISLISIGGCDTFSSEPYEDHCKVVLSKPMPPDFDCNQHMIAEHSRCENEQKSNRKFQDGSSTGGPCVLESCKSAFERSLRGQWELCTSLKAERKWKW